MDATWKAKWLAALRSGKYEQGRERLRSHDNKFCCLGVLADLARPTDWDEDPTVFSAIDGSSSYQINGCWSYLPNEIASVTGLPDAHQKKLTHMNDCGLSFSKIADWIEANL